MKNSKLQFWIGIAFLSLAIGGWLFKSDPISVWGPLILSAIHMGRSEILKELE